MNEPLTLLLTVIAGLGAMFSVLWGLVIFRIAVAWTGFALGALWGWMLGATIGGTPQTALIGAVIGALVLGVLAGTAEKLMAALVGGFGGWFITLGICSAFGMHGEMLSFAALAGALNGALFSYLVHDPLVALAIGGWGTGFLRLGESVRGEVTSAMPADAWLRAPELLVEGRLGGTMADPHLRLLILVGFCGTALTLQRWESAEHDGDRHARGGPRTIRRAGLLCFFASLVPLLAPIVGSTNAAKWAAWLHLPAHALGLEAATWPAATLLCWILVGWTRRRPPLLRALAAAVCGVAMLGFGALVQWVTDGVPLRPLLESVMVPSGFADPEWIAAAAFAFVLLIFPLAGPIARKKA